MLRPNAVAIPFRLRPEEPEDDGHHGRIKAREDLPTEPIANLSQEAREYLKALGFADPDHDLDAASLIWFHSQAIGYSALYLRENTCGVRYNWPRIPMPVSKEELVNSALLGKNITELLNTEACVKGVTESALRSEMKVIACFTVVAGEKLDPAKHLKIEVGWGHEGKDNVVMGGKGKLVERDYTHEERESIREGAVALRLSLEEALIQLGEKTADVYLNDQAYWKNVPLKVWGFAIGGYQVMKKWLSYREAKLLGRRITTDEAYYFRDMVRRIAALCLLQPLLDANYIAIKTNTFIWPALIVSNDHYARFQTVSAED